MVVELTDEELAIMGEALILYKLTFEETRKAYSELKEQSWKQSEIKIYEYELEQGRKALEIMEKLIAKLEINGDDIHNIL